ncbi:MAG: ADP-ribosyl-[dinitrogen reductase] hydrolase [Hydrogenophilus sp.]|nr:ADP-ribosyl-[dinitrogen reductase] hydrolase [Hydrogenophilus sp.]
MQRLRDVLWKRGVSEQEWVARAEAAYVGLAVGDALGATVEFMTPKEIAAAYGVHDSIRGGGWLRLRRGAVTDDTEMNLALGEAILERGGLDVWAVARAFDRWLRGKPVDVGHTVRRGIVHFRINGEPLVPYDSYAAGNGAAMRVLPVAIAAMGCDEGTVRAACRWQGRVTHHHPLSDAACEWLGIIAQRALAGASRAELLNGPVAQMVATHPEFAYTGRSCLNPSGYVVDTVVAVMQAFAQGRDFASTLIDVVNRGGDADTTGAISGMIAGAVYGSAAIPRRWLEALDQTVRRRCCEQARALAQLALEGRFRLFPLSGPAVTAKESGDYSSSS